MIAQLIRSTILGLLPDILFFTMAMHQIKQWKQNRKKTLFFLIGMVVIYAMCMFWKPYEWISYMVFIIATFILLMLCDRKHTYMSDMFVLAFLFSYICVTSGVIAIFLEENQENYYICLLISKILLLVPFFFQKKLLILYKRYCQLWNRNDHEKRRIKSITLRVISVISLCVLSKWVSMAIVSIVHSM